MAETYNIPTIIKGDTFRALKFTVTLNSVALDLTGYTIECKFRKNAKTGKLIKSIDTTSGITLTTPASGVFTIDAFDLGADFVAGNFYYDVQFTDTSGIITTFIKGFMKVEQDVTY